MADIRIERAHTLGLPAARNIALTWTEQAEEKFDMACTYEQGESGDQVNFIRSGVSGTLTVTADSFALNARLGFLLSAFKERIEAEIAKNLDQLMADNRAAGE
jgi:putative polyhydroxyalkanoate system protein